MEAEFHTAWLKRHHIRTIKDLVRLPKLVPRKELRFVRIDLKALTRALRRHAVRINSNLWRAKELPSGLQRELLRYRAFGMKNTHRLLIGLKTNERLERAIEVWAEEWAREDDS